MFDQTKADLAERIAAIPPVTYTGATLCGVPVTDLTSWAMFIYALLLIGWHVKTKWMAPKGQGGGQ